MDFSASAIRALDVALNLARQAHEAVTLIHVIEWLSEEDPRTSAHFKIPEFRSHRLGDVNERLHDLVAEESRTWREIDKVVVFGRAHREVLRVAGEHAADLIVMGAQGRGGLDLALFGSTTQQVVRGASCPVLTVRAEPQAVT